MVRIMYLANPCTPEVVATMLDGRLGYIDTPAQGNKRPDGVRWAADNGAFGGGYPGDDAFMAWLERNDPADCLFAVAPDVVCDHQRTYRRSSRLMAKIRALGYPVAFVVQNGAQPYNVPWDEFDVMFIGGDTDWKLGPVARTLVEHAKRLGKWVHMGRVNSHRRLRYADLIGCDSADGTHMTFAPDENLPKILDWVTEIESQGSLFQVAS